VERKRLFDILERLVPWEPQTTLGSSLRLEPNRTFIDGDLPKVLDPFGGGGGDPPRGDATWTPDLHGRPNPVAVLIQRAMLEIPVDLPAGHRRTGAQHSQGIWMAHVASHQTSKHTPSDAR